MLIYEYILTKIEFSQPNWKFTPATWCEISRRRRLVSLYKLEISKGLKIFIENPLEVFVIIESKYDIPRQRSFFSFVERSLSFLQYRHQFEYYVG